MLRARYWGHGHGEPLALALPSEQLPVHVLGMCSVPVQVIRRSTSVMRCSQPRQEVTSQPDGPCGWGQPPGSQWTAADSMDPRRFLTGQVPLLRRMRPIALRLDLPAWYGVHGAATLHGQCFSCAFGGDKYPRLAETTSGSRPGLPQPRRLPVASSTRYLGCLEAAPYRYFISALRIRLSLFCMMECIQAGSLRAFWPRWADDPVFSDAPLFRCFSLSLSGPAAVLPRRHRSRQHSAKRQQRQRTALGHDSTSKYYNYSRLHYANMNIYQHLPLASI